MKVILPMRPLSALIPKIVLISVPSPGRKWNCCMLAGSAFLAGKATPRTLEFQNFCDTTHWLHDFALFMALKHHFHDESWNRWPEEASRITPRTYQKYAQEFAQEIAVQKYLQWQFSRQWQELRSYANERGIAVIGDIPIFVAHDSADVWSHRELFLLDEQGDPTVVAGVPPDYFSYRRSVVGQSAL